VARKNRQATRTPRRQRPGRFALVLRSRRPRAQVASRSHWLGHSNPSSTQHYARITPLTLTKAYTDAGYFGRKVRTIEVLLDRDAITSGDAGTGPLEFYDLGHGSCSYIFFEQCPHRVACARCDIYLPKQSSESKLLEARNGLQRMLVQIPLTDEERTAVEGDEAALDRLADVPTPAGSRARADRETSGTAGGEKRQASDIRTELAE
jgi:hypothetical protein